MGAAMRAIELAEEIEARDSGAGNRESGRAGIDENRPPICMVPEVDG